MLEELEKRATASEFALIGTIQTAIKKDTEREVVEKIKEVIKQNCNPRTEDPFIIDRLRMLISKIRESII